MVAPLGTEVPMLPEPQLVTVASIPLNVTVLVPCVDPKLEPLIVTDCPMGPEFVDKLEMLGTKSTVNVALLLCVVTPVPFATTFTTTLALPGDKLPGTVATMLVSDQVVVDAVVPLNVTVLLPLVKPNCVPVIVTDVPGAPEVGEMLDMDRSLLTVGPTVM